MFGFFLGLDLSHLKGTFIQNLYKRIEPNIRNNMTLTKLIHKTNEALKMLGMLCLVKKKIIGNTKLSNITSVKNMISIAS